MKEWRWIQNSNLREILEQYAPIQAWGLLTCLRNIGILLETYWEDKFSFLFGTMGLLGIPRPWYPDFVKVGCRSWPAHIRFFLWGKFSSISWQSLQCFVTGSWLSEETTLLVFSDCQSELSCIEDFLIFCVFYMPIASQAVFVCLFDVRFAPSKGLCLPGWLRSQYVDCQDLFSIRRA